VSGEKVKGEAIDISGKVKEANSLLILLPAFSLLIK
jgi:hypothetical protein